MPGRDHQRGRVYTWEDRVVAPHDPSTVPFVAAQGMVDAIWSEMGLLYPPRIEPLPAGIRKRLADANRLTMRLPATTPSWCLLHEIAHAMSSDHDGSGDGHGAVFMGLYVQLLVRYLRFNAGDLQASAEASGLQIAPQARPTFVTP